MSKLPFLERLAGGPILADGAMGTVLHSKGITFETNFEQLNILDADLVYSVHMDYLRAGAELIETNTFGGNKYRLLPFGLDGDIEAINRAGVLIAQRALRDSGREGYVAGAVGPLGVQIEPFGRVTRLQAYDAFFEQISALSAAGVDCLIMETMTDLHELEEAIHAARTVDPDLPIIAQMTFTRDDRTLLGNQPGQVAARLAELGVSVVGMNCSNGPAQARRIIRAMQKAVRGLHVSALPNAGWPEVVNGRVMYAATPDYFADFAASMREAGVQVIGGCCGTTPAHIAAMRATLDAPPAPRPQAVIVSLPEEAEETVAIEAPSQLARKLAHHDFVIAVEVNPPRGIATEKLLRAASLLKDAGADVVDVTDSPMARMRMSPWAVCHLIEKDAGIESVLHFPTRGRNLLRVQGDLLAAHALGIRNLFVVMGDPTRIGDYPDAADNYDLVPSGLIKLVKQSLNQGIDWAGNSIGQPTNFLVSSALNLNATDLDAEIKTLRKKLENGTDYLLTQPIYDPEIYTHFMAYYESKHGPLPVPVLVGLLPLYSQRHANFLNNEVPGIDIPEAILARISAAGDAAPREGVRIAQELASALRGRMAQGGLYLIPQFGRYDLAAEIVEGVRQPQALS